MQEAQNQTESLQTLVEDLQMKNQGTGHVFGEIILAQKNTQPSFQVKPLTVDPLKRIHNRQFRNLSQNVRVFKFTTNA